MVSTANVGEHNSKNTVQVATGKTIQLLFNYHNTQCFSNITFTTAKRRGGTTLHIILTRARRRGHHRFRNIKIKATRKWLYP